MASVKVSPGILMASVKVSPGSTNVVPTVMFVMTPVKDPSVVVKRVAFKGSSERMGAIVSNTSWSAVPYTGVLLRFVLLLVVLEMLLRSSTELRWQLCNTEQVCVSAHMN
jgi:hypothetical protein